MTANMKAVHRRRPFDPAVMNVFDRKLSISENRNSASVEEEWRVENKGGGMVRSMRHSFSSFSAVKADSTRSHPVHST